jgi:hypothetical protein
MLSISQVNRKPTRRMVSWFVLTLDVLYFWLLIQKLNQFTIFFVISSMGESCEG